MRKKDDKSDREERKKEKGIRARNSKRMKHIEKERGEIVNQLINSALEGRKKGGKNLNKRRVVSLLAVRPLRISTQLRLSSLSIRHIALLYTAVSCPLSLSYIVYTHSL